MTEADQENAGKTCPECHTGNLVVKSGRYGNFTACSNFPNCRYIEKKNSPTGGAPAEDTGEICDKCGVGKLVIRNGNFGKFIACDQYPKCRNTKKFPA